MFAATNIAKGDGDFFVYVPIHVEKRTIAAGDVLEYDIYLDKGNPAAVGGIEFTVTGGSLYKSGAADRDGIRANGKTPLPAAVGKWHHRAIPLDRVAGQTTKRFTATFLGDAPGRYVQFLDNVVLTHADGRKTILYDGGDPPLKSTDEIRKEGFSKHVVFKPVPRAEVVEGKDLRPLYEKEIKATLLDEELGDLRVHVEVFRKIADRERDPHMREHAGAAKVLLERAEKSDPESDTFRGIVAELRRVLVHDHPVMKKYAGQLVGHAHIDFQWLWEWTETIKVCRSTFGQALEFMHEFPGFKFSQSSSALYAATEEHHPDVFRGIRQQVEAGNWEIVGGRVSEADEHMISPESHARHFLYGQRYFRERFNGKQATVGWEPDGYGHTWQMPQILLNGGCRYFYFCRGGTGEPLFWWQSPDGSRVLAFDEPASGGWYNGDVSMKNFERLGGFAERTGMKDMLWVYGVGNHGGGPTRENIETALAFQGSDSLPTVKFSTASDFFRRLESSDTTKLPVVNDDLNPTQGFVFDGTYTSHSTIKRLNRDAEATTESAEAIAAVASRYGFAYPGPELRRIWEQITWNQHHDTLPGVAIHSSYERSYKILEGAIESARGIGTDALAWIASRVGGDQDSVVVFNPSAFERDGIVEVDVPADVNVAVAGNVVVPLQRDAKGRAVFFAAKLPSLGYRSYRLESRAAVPGERAAAVHADGTVLENADYKVVVDPARGVVTEIIDKATGRNSLTAGGSGNRLEVYWEEPVDMSSWIIGKIAKVEPLVSPVRLEVLESGPVRASIGFDRQFQTTILRQKISLAAAGPPEFELATEWKELGDGRNPSPFLKVAFDVAADAPKFVLQIPFGDIEKPLDGEENPALTFADISGAGAGASLLNDSKHGYSASGHTLRLSLIRSDYSPDPRPNDRPQMARWSFVPHAGDWRGAGIVKRAHAFNHPVWTARVLAGADRPLPGEMSFLSAGAGNVLVTGVKKAEDDADLVVRFYEAHGNPATDTITTPWKVLRTQRVNFLEDPVEPKAGGALRGYEIRTLKLQTGQ